VTQRLHWSFPDPSIVQGTREQKLAFTRKVRDQIKAKIQAWCEEVCAPVTG
jgi:arsenate reductase